MESEDKTTKSNISQEQEDDASTQEATPQQTDAQAAADTDAVQEEEGSGMEPTSDDEGVLQPEAELEAAKNRAAENWEKFIRLQAEFENYKKRMHKEQSESLKYAQLPVLREMAGILDNFERAVEHARTNQNPELEGIISGVGMVVQQMVSAFEKFGMSRIKALGEVFDPTCHEAMSIKETDEVPENQVVEEFQAGYTLHDRVVRPAMVVVSKKPSANDESAEEPAEG